MTLSWPIAPAAGCNEIGRTGRQVAAVGLGRMGMWIAYGPAMAPAEAVKSLREALELGVDHFNTATMRRGCRG